MAKKRRKRRDYVYIMPFGKSIRVRDIIGEYCQSHKYLKLCKGSKELYQVVIRYFDGLILANNKTLFSMEVHKIDYGIVDYIHNVMSHTLSGATIKLYFSVLSNAWHHSLRLGKVPYNPWLKNEVRVKNERDTVWQPEEIKLAVDTANDKGYHVLALYIVLAYETGVRPWIDLRNLKWENFKQHEDGNYIIDFVISKTNVHLMLPLSIGVRDILLSMARHNDYIFCNASGRHYTRQAISWQLDKVKESANLPKELQFRDIRRTVNTELAEKGATREELRSINGWKSDRHIPRYARIRYGVAKNGLQKRWAVSIQEGS